MFDLEKLTEKYWGRLRFYAAMGDRPFAEIMIEDKMITIRIVSFKVLVEAMISHIFRKKRFASFKLKTLKDSGYKIRIRFGRLYFDI
jgi:hypothetical protein